MNEQFDILGGRLMEFIDAYRKLEGELAESREECATLKSRIVELEGDLRTTSLQLQKAETDLEKAQTDISNKNETATTLLKQIENILMK